MVGLWPYLRRYCLSHSPGPLVIRRPRKCLTPSDLRLFDTNRHFCVGSMSKRWQEDFNYLECSDKWDLHLSARVAWHLMTSHFFREIYNYLPPSNMAYVQVFMIIVCYIASTDIWRLIIGWTPHLRVHGNPSSPVMNLFLKQMQYIFLASIHHETRYEHNGAEWQPRITREMIDVVNWGQRIVLHLRSSWPFYSCRLYTIFD